MRSKIIFGTIVFMLGAAFVLYPANLGQDNLLITATPTPTPIPEQYRWDLEAIYPDKDAWEKDYKTVSETFIPRYANYQGKLGKLTDLLELLKLDEEASRMMDKLYVYASMSRDGNQTDSTFSEMTSRADALYSDLGAAASFIRPELIALPRETLDGYTKEEQLKDYKRFFEELIKNKAHTLSKEEENLLAMSGEVSGAAEEIATKIREADIQFPTIKDKDGNEIQLSEAKYAEVLTNPDRQLRKKAFEGMLGAYNNSKYSLAAALDAQMRSDSFYAKARKYESALASALGANNIPVSVYDNLVSATNKNLTSLQRYVTLRKNVLGVDTVHSYDMSLSLVDSFEKEISYEDAQKIVGAGLAPMGKEYISAMQAALKGRWIDVYPQDNKTSGAYSWGSYDTHPYILLNFTPTVDGALTLSHEMGHALNSYYINKNQKYVNSNISIFTAEVASTTNEMMVLRYLIDNAKDDTEKLYYLDQLAESVRGTFFTQVMYAEFEKEIHERIDRGEALSVDSLNELWGKMIQKYYGPDYEVDELAKVGWARVPHFYYNFYVYQYATGIAASNQFVLNINGKQAGSVDKYLAFLSAGSSDFPVEVLKDAGVDMNSTAPVDNLLKEFGNVLDQMEKILKAQGKIK